MPTSTAILSEEQQQQRQEQLDRNDDSWLRTPPGGPQVADKQTSMELDAAVIDLSPAAPTKSLPTTRSFAMDDLEAAETLAGFARQSSPPVVKPTPITNFPTYPPSTTQPQPEPLLSLLTSQHPLIGSAINGSLSAYNFGKSYSSQFRYGAEYVERNIASPVASTVGTAGRITGVENGVRRWLTRGRSHQSNGESSNGEASNGETTTVATPAEGSAMSSTSSNGTNKRRREDSEVDADQPQPTQRSRAGSEISISQGEYLPAYDSNMSPTYSSRDPYPPLSPQQHSLGNSTWQTRLILSTSGLGIAMSGESRRSLKYCLRWLRWANGRLGRLVFSLQSLLAEYDATAQHRNGNGTSANGRMQQFQLRDQAVITAQLAALRTECEKVLKKAVDVVSNYTGGALPENARALVHRHLTSLPARFAFALRGEREALGEDEEMANGDHHLPLEANGVLASSSGASRNIAHTNGAQSDAQSDAQANGTQAEKSESEIRRDTVRAAKRMVVLAREGLEMMGQVSLVVDSTITSAEEWCNRLGRRIPEDENAEMALISNGDSEPVQVTPPAAAAASMQDAHALSQSVLQPQPHSQPASSATDRLPSETEMEMEIEPS